MSAPFPPHDTPTGPPSAPPPGWYPDGPHLRWWDGAQWGPFAGPTPPLPEEEQGKTMAVLSHLGPFAGGFILPLILYLIEKGKPDRNRFVCHHACEALNFAITFYLCWFGGFIALFATSIASIPDSPNADPPVGIFVFFPLMFILMGLYFVFGIVGMIKAGKGVWGRYPVNIRFVGRGIDWRQA